METGGTLDLDLEAIRAQLILYRLGNRNKPDIEWASGLMNGLVEAQVNSIRGHLRLEWGDRPDFRLSFPELQRSLEFEVTMAASEAHQAAMRSMAADDGITHLEPAVFAAAPELSSRHREVGIGRDWKHLRGRGWAGTEAESQWCTFIQNAIERKRMKFHEYNFDQLMIYDDSPVAGCDQLLSRDSLA